MTALGLALAQPFVKGGAKAAAILAEAVFWIDAADANAATLIAPNRGTGGSALDARYGSVAGADTNDPVWLPAGSVNGSYVYMAGPALNYMSIPYAANLDILGDIELVARISMDDWTGAACGVIEHGVSDPLRHFVWRFEAAGTMRLIWYPLGTSASGISSATSAVIPAIDGQNLWLKATLDVDNGAGGYDVKYYTCADQATEPTGGQWTQLGTTITGVGVTNLTASTQAISVGSVGVPPIAGRTYRVILRNGIGGTTVLDVDCTQNLPSSEGAASFTATTGQTVTFIRVTAGRKLVVVGPGGRARWLFGTDDYMEVPDNDLLDFSAAESFTAIAVIRQWATATAYQYMGKNGSGTPITGWSIGVSRGVAGDGAIQAITSITSPTAGLLSCIATVRLQPNDLIQRYINGAAVTAADSTTLTLANAFPMRIGRDGGAAASYQDFEGATFILWRRILSPSEIAAIQVYYGAG